jgi:putative tricarboxylic transport membrane protein
MDILNNLFTGFAIALTPLNLLWCFIGVFMGTIVGILPGLGPSATVALLLPLAAQMDPTGGLIMMSGIYYGAKYGGSTTSILLNVPGESASVVTCLDGFEMARNGRAGPALGIAAISSFVAGTVGVVLLMLVAPPVAEFALRFGPPEYFALMAFGLSMVVLLAGKSMLKALLSMFVGLWLSTIGIDMFTDSERFTFDQIELLDGVQFVVVAIGTFAVAEVLANLTDDSSQKSFEVPKGWRNLMPTWQDMKDSRFAFLNGSIVGFFVGVLPGAGSTIASFVSYGIEKAVSKHPEKFGTGVVEGVAAPEAANNSETGGALVPLMTLGIPGSATTAILLAAFIMWGLRPGPLLIQDNPQLFWGLVASMYIGNVMLLIMNLPMVPVFAQILRLPGYVLYPLILGVSIIGVFSVDQRLLDTWLVTFFGLLGFLMRKVDYPAAPLILGLVLGDLMENAVRQSLMMSQGDAAILYNRPLALVILIMTALVLIGPLFRQVAAWRGKVADQEA